MNPLQIARWTWLLAAVAAAFCGSAIAGEDEAQQIRAAEDRSLTTEQYSALGMPPDNRAWTLLDYRAAARAIQAIAAKDPRELPRRGSARSGDLFARMANPENLATIANEPVPFETRARMIHGLLTPTSSVLDVYIRARTPEGGFSAEVVDLYSLMLHLTVSVAQASEEFIASVPADDPTRPRRVEARVKMMRNLGGATRTTLEALSHTAFDRYERLRLAEQARSTLPKFVSHLEQEQRQAIVEDLKGLRDRQNDEPVAEAIQRLIGTITPTTKPSTRQERSVRAP